ncbi:MAG: TonB family protein [Gammaproteobacteria bacterium]
MIARYGLAVGVGVAVTFGLLFVMQLLIASGQGRLDEKREVRLVDMVRVEREEVVERKQQKPEKPPEPERQPDLPNTSMNTNFDAGLAVSVSAPQFSSSGVQVGGLGVGVSDGEYLPIVKVQPVYPQRAAQRGLEGYVIVEFTVTRTGTTKDIRVVESTNPIFDKPAMDAAAKFKYKPRVINGEPVEVPGVRNKITFVLER